MKLPVMVITASLLATSAWAAPSVMNDSELDSVVAGTGYAIGVALQAAADAENFDNAGYLIAGDIYGNTSNPSGNGNGVLPSLAPGPWTCTDTSDCAGPTTAGGSMGDFVAPYVSDGQGDPNFANDKIPGPDFSNP